MEIMKECTKRLNLHVKPETYEEIKRSAQSEGRKVGNMVRRILDEWTENKGKEYQ